MTTKAALYVRVSSEQQLDALPAQQRAVTEEAERRGYTVVALFADEGISAHTNDVSARPQFQALVQAAQAGAFDVIIVSDLDRWSRDLRLFIETLEQLTALHIPLISLAQRIDYGTADGKFVAHMMGAQAQFYSDVLSERTARGKRERAIRGKQNNAPPFGYVKDGQGSATFDPQTEAAAREMWRLAADGQTDRQVAEALANLGHRVSRDTVRYLVTNRFFLGQVRHRGEWFAGRQPAMIDAETFAVVQAHRQSNRRMASRPDSQPRGAVHVYTFGGLLTCAECGRHITGHDAGTQYICWGRRGHGCQAPMVTDAALSSQFTFVLAQVVLSEPLIAALLAERHEPPPPIDRDAIERRLVRLRQLYELGDMPLDDYMTRRTALRDQLAEPLPVPGPQDVIALAAHLRNLVLLWQRGTPAERQKIAGMLVVDILVRDQQIVALMPQRAWRPLWELILPAHEHDGYRAVTGA